MTLSFSSEEMKNIVNSDTGFNEQLESLPPDQAQYLKNLVSNGDLLVNILQLIPDSSKPHVESSVKQIIETPQKARELFEQCRYFEARKLLQKSISIYSNQPRTGMGFLDSTVEFVCQRLQALLFNLLGDVQWELGNSHLSKESYQKSVALAEKIGDKDTYAKTLAGLGRYFGQIGDLDSALEYNYKALEIISGLPDRWNIQNQVISNLCLIYDSIGQHDEALEYGEFAFDLCMQSEDIKNFPAVCNNLGCFYGDLEEYAHAYKLFETALDSARANQNLHQEVQILNNYAICLLQSDNSPETVKESLSLLINALSISDNMDSAFARANTLMNMGLAHYLIGGDTETEKILQEAIQLFGSAGSKSNEALALNILGNYLKKYKHNTIEAVTAFDKSININEEIRRKLKKEFHRISYADMFCEAYEMAVKCRFDLNQPQIALDYIERAKAKSLIDLLSGNLIINKKGKSAQLFSQAAAILNEIDEINAALEAVSLKDSSFLKEGLIRSKADKDKEYAQSLLDALDDKNRAFKIIYTELVNSSPEEASLIYRPYQETEHIRCSIPQDTVILNLFQAERELSIVFIFPDNFAAHSIVNISMQEGLENVHNIYQLMSIDKLSSVRSHEFMRNFKIPMTHLYDLLFEQIKPLLKKFKRILISPHLFWHYFPFHLLFDKNEQLYLCDQVEIGYTPSVSALNYCMKKNRLHKDRALILAKNSGDLPHIESEVSMISAACDTLDKKIFTNENAFLSKAESLEKPYDIIHIACHGYFDHHQPFLSGIDIPPNPNEFRKTYLLDFYNKNLNCNLVTLSACESGLSHLSNADELVGLSRGLFFAGASSVMLGLWKVADSSTSTLMENFYWHYIQNNRTKTRSLQLAMQAVKSQPDFAHPFFWAPFVVIGDWR